MSRPIPVGEEPERPRSRSRSLGLQQASLRLSETPRSRGSPRNGGTPVGSYGNKSRRVSVAGRTPTAAGASSPARFVEGFRVPADVHHAAAASASAGAGNGAGSIFTPSSFAADLRRADAFMPAAGTSLLSGTPRSVSRAGGFDGPAGQEDAEVVDRHLDPNAEEDEFRSLQLQGGDVHRQVYQWSQQQKLAQQARRSQSFYLPRPVLEDESARNLKVPGGFRRNYIAQQHTQNDTNSVTSRRASIAYGTGGNAIDEEGHEGTRPQFLTRNFIEFLSLYGHFAGEDLEEEEEEESAEDEIDAVEEAGNVADSEPEHEDDRPPHERRPLLTPRKSTRRRAGIRPMDERGDASVTKAVLLLLKSFVGTGVLFLPKAFLNGGMLFSSLVLLGVSAISLYCFLLLVNTRLVVNGSFGDIGGHLYGKYMRIAILASIAISQIGFVCAYTAFTAENLGAFIRAVTNGKQEWSMPLLIAIQLVLFLPLSMIRDIGKLGFTALIADFFILLGLVYLYYADVSQILDRGVADIVLFNETNWTLFIGTAIFTFEGIGLIIPITQAMKEPEKFPAALGGVMLFITVLFTSIGALSYAAFGSRTKTVILSNLPQTNRFVNAVQLLYSLAILLSTPLQLFPAIRILETGCFAAARSGKFSKRTKWSKNLFRVGLVLVAALIAYLGADDLDKFVSLIGSFACVPLVFVYPPLLHMRACRSTRGGRIADLALAVFGVAAMIYTTVTSVRSWAAA